MTGFAKHGIDAASVSMGNTFEAAPAAYVMQYMFKLRSAGNQNTARGSATEVGFERAWGDEFSEFDLARGQQAALDDFNRQTALVVAPELREKEAALLNGFVEQTVEALKEYGRPHSTQNKLVGEVDFGDGKVDVLGYDDFVWETPDKVVIDLKTTKACPSEMRAQHRRQIAVYHHLKGGDYRCGVTYVTPKKHATYWLTDDECEAEFDEFRNILRKMNRFLLTFDSAEHAASCLTPDYSSFYFGDANFRSQARQIFAQ